MQYSDHDSSTAHDNCHVGRLRLGGCYQVLSGNTGMDKIQLVHRLHFVLPDNGMLLGLYPTDKLAEDVGIHSRPSALPTTGAPPFRGFTLAYCTKSIEEVDQIFADLRIKGVTILKEPEKVFWGGYSGYMADPDHNLWEIAYNPYLQMDDQGKLV